MIKHLKLNKGNKSCALWFLALTHFSCPNIVTFSITRSFRSYILLWSCEWRICESRMSPFDAALMISESMLIVSHRQALVNFTNIKPHSTLNKHIFTNLLVYKIFVCTSVHLKINSCCIIFSRKLINHFKRLDDKRKSSDLVKLLFLRSC